ncbi:MAG TPA: ACT domain-containing protein [Vicinamibacterales bacterium]|nr:ACT domain-containing protein [Vicinamibacterales bacterium]
MASFIQRMRTAMNAFGQAWKGEAPAAASRAAAHDTSGISFADAAASPGDPRTWLAVFEVAVVQNAPVSAVALDTMRAAAARLNMEAILPDAASRQRFTAWLRPRPGLSARLTEMHGAGLLGAMFPELGVITLAARAIAMIERLPSQATVSGERFGGLLSEIRSPELLVAARLFRDAPAAAARLSLPPSSQQIVDFLVKNDEQMGRVAFRRDAEDPDVVRSFAALVSSEETLKMLAILTLANLGAMSPELLTPWKEELLWRLYVDAYNEITMAYGDQVIEDDQAAVAAVHAGLPSDISAAEITAFLGGLPRRYLTLFEPETIYEHARLARDITQDDVHFFLKKKGDFWELTVVTLDKPFLFSNICGVLAYFGMNILRGYALTSHSTLVLDVFQFTDKGGFFARQDSQAQFNARLADVVAGRVDITERLAGGEKTRASRRTAPVIYFDNEHSRQYTILELVVDDQPGLLHKISRVVSRHGLSVELVLISTEGDKAIDVFHLKKGEDKLADSDQLALTEDLERALEDHTVGGAVEADRGTR